MSIILLYSASGAHGGMPYKAAPVGTNRITGESCEFEFTTRAEMPVVRITVGHTSMCVAQSKLRIASRIASMKAGSRPSEKFGTHSIMEPLGFFFSIKLIMVQKIPGDFPDGRHDRDRE